MLTSECECQQLCLYEACKTSSHQPGNEGLHSEIWQTQITDLHRSEEGEANWEARSLTSLICEPQCEVPIWHSSTGVHLEGAVNRSSVSSSRQTVKGRRFPETRAAEGRRARVGGGRKSIWRRWSRERASESPAGQRSTGSTGC